VAVFHLRRALRSFIRDEALRGRMMTKMRYWPIILLLIIMAAPQRSLAQQQPAEEPLESLWINLPSTPLRFFSNPDGIGYSLNNYSIGYIVQYRLGCVLEQGGSIKILSKRDAKAISLKPMSSGEVHGWSVLPLTGRAFDPCKKGKLTVIEVLFKDGAVWKIK
jgi:hypothetical protein